MAWHILLLALCMAGGCVAVSNESYLLPTEVRPSHYDLRLLYDVDPTTNFSFYGTVDITLSVVKATSKIVLHAQGFNIQKEKVSFTHKSAPAVASVELVDTYNFLTINLAEPLKTHLNYTLTIPFYGNLKTGLDGVYISTYNDKATKSKQYLIVTQFEAISARKGFPCFDEPIFKATYRITIGHQKELSAVSNMPLESSSKTNTLEKQWPWSRVAKTFQKEESMFVWDTFQESVPMSTYLVAFVVSKFANVKSPAGLSSTEFRIWARKDAIDQTSYAAKIGPKVLSHFEEFFNVSFPLPKQDMFAIPDFSAGAMENWGLITYRETSLLYDKEQSSFTNKERVAEVIAHELAHQWFGNLVTMKWWSDLWLNEGFATYVASIGVDAVEPTWHADINYAAENIQILMNLDALESSHPVSVPLDHPDRITEIFDEISYKKGATLIRMMTLFLGADVFRKGLHNYLVKYSYGNADQDDLWKELTDVSLEYGGLTRNVTVKDVMDTWTTQTGYPLITVSRDYTDSTLFVSQKRYLSSGLKSPTKISWWIPLSVMCESEVGQKPDPVQWLANNEGVETKHHFEHSANANEWIIFNPDMIAPYRINYDQRNWKLLINTLSSDKFTNIPVLGRVQILSDAFALAWSGEVDYSIALQAASYLQREKEYLPISTGLHALAKIEAIVKRSPDYGAFQKFVRKVIGQQYQQAGGLSIKKIINGDNVNSVKLQTLTSSWACKVKIPGCEENAVELLQQWMDEPDPDSHNPIPLDLRRTVYCVGISRGSVLQWRFLLARLGNTNVAAAQQALQQALACTREVWILAQYLEWAITDNSDVRRQDSARVITTIATSTVGYYIAKDFIYNRIDDIARAFAGQGRRLGFVVKALLGQFTTQRELDEFLVWKDNHTEILVEHQFSVTQAIENAKVNIDWVKRNRNYVVEKLREFATDYHDSTPSPSSRRSRLNYIHSIFAIHNLTSQLAPRFRLTMV